MKFGKRNYRTQVDQMDCGVACKGGRGNWL